MHPFFNGCKKILHQYAPIWVQDHPNTKSAAFLSGAAPEQPCRILVMTGTQQLRLLASGSNHLDMSGGDTELPLLASFHKRVIEPVDRHTIPGLSSRSLCPSAVWMGEVFYFLKIYLPFGLCAQSNPVDVNMTTFRLALK